MFIGFQVANFRSFREPQTFSMVAGRFPEHAGLNTFDPGLPGLPLLLRSAVIYGPNAAGKTNLLRAIDFMKNFVLQSAARTGMPLPFQPFRLSRIYASKPSEFEISFARDDSRFEYSFSLSQSRVEAERLVEYTRAGTKTRPRVLFDRTWNEGKSEYAWNFSAFLKGPRAAWRSSTRPDALFLSTAIQLNVGQLRPVFDWFGRLIVLVDRTGLNQSLTYQMLDSSEGRKILLPFLREADLGIADLLVKKEPLPATGMLVGAGLPPIIQPGDGNTPPSVLRVQLAHEGEDPSEPISFGLEDESAGTLSMFTMAGAWLNALRNGEVLMGDEVGQSLHPALLRYLIKMFHTPSVNGKNAQLVCNTHDTTLLDQRLFRRDQVWFVEKERGGWSKLYPLTDFKPRNDEVLDTWYERGRYGAQPMLPGLNT